MADAPSVSGIDIVESQAPVKYCTMEAVAWQRLDQSPSHAAD